MAEINVVIEDVGPCKKKLKVQVPQSEVANKIDESYKKLRSTVAVDGFRPGRAPRRLLERRFHEQVTEEVKQALLSEATSKAMEKHGLTPIGEPSFDNIEFDASKDFRFDITVEVEPEISIEEYKALPLVRKSAEVTEEELQRGLENIRRRRAILTPIPGGRAQLHDHIICDWEVRCGEELVANEKDDEIIFLPGLDFANMEIQEIVKLLEGAATGEQREGVVRFSESHPLEKYRGKEGRLVLTIKEIKRPIPPELTEELAKELGFDSLKDLKSYVKERLEADKCRWVEEDLEEQVRNHLLARAKFDVPEGLVKAQAREYLVRQQLRLRYRGVPEEEIRKHIEAMRVASEEAAERVCRLFFIMGHIAEKEKLYVTEDEVENRIARMASARGLSAERMRRLLEQENELSSLRALMREEKTMEFLLKHAEIRDEGPAPVQAAS